LDLITLKWHLPVLDFHGLPSVIIHKNLGAGLWRALQWPVSQIIVKLIWGYREGRRIKKKFLGIKKTFLAEIKKNIN
jgi:hypothetical protein